MTTIIPKKQTPEEYTLECADELMNIAYDAGGMLRKMAENTPRLPQYVCRALIAMSTQLQDSAVTYECALEDESPEEEAYEQEKVESAAIVPFSGFRPGDAMVPACPNA